MHSAAQGSGDARKAAGRLLVLATAVLAGGGAGWLQAAASGVKSVSSLIGVAYLLAFVAGVSSFWAP